MILLLLALQQDFTVSRIEKAEYGPALKRVKDAEALLETDPRGAVEILDPLLAAPLPKIEGRLRVETRPGEFSELQPFFPYQLRGRALAGLARKDPGGAAKLLERAIADFELSAKKGVASSQAMATSARAELAALKTVAPPSDPEPAFRAGWSDLLRARRFADARAHVEKAGAFLAAERRKTYLQQTDDECRTRVGEVWLDFLRELRVSTPASLEALSPEEYASRFALTDRAQVCVASAELEWAFAFRGLLDRLRRREDALDALLAAAGVAKDDAFGPAADLAWAVAEARVQKDVEATATAPRAERDRLSAAATSTRRRWAEWVDSLPKAAGDRVRARGAALDALLAKVPVDLEDARRAGESLDATFASDRPAADLDKIERHLARLYAEEGARLSVDSRRELLSHLLAAAVLRRLLEGKSPEEEVLKRWAADLKVQGGPIDLSRFGPKLARALAKLTSP
ncbi:MAG TPA: hypothetical protein VF950_13490 [Planctomycetota bacterium]